MTVGLSRYRDLKRPTAQRREHPSSFLPKADILQRACSCGQHTHGNGECAACRKGGTDTSSAVVRNAGPEGSFSGAGQTSSTTDCGYAGSAAVDFSRITSRRLQGKPAIGESHDRYEQEADRVADFVMQGSIQPQASPSALRQPFAQRACKKCEKELVQRKTAGEMTPTAPELETIDSLDGGGQPLPASERSFFEARMGHDFGQVRVHTDTHADSLARSVQARAFTYGNHIVLQSGEPLDASPGSRHLLAHELTHTIQQGASPSIAGLTSESGDAISSGGRALGGVPTIQRLAPELVSGLTISGSSEVNHYCAKYVPSDALSCGVFPAPNTSLTAAGSKTTRPVSWSILTGATKASIVGPDVGPTVAIQGKLKSVKRNDVTVQATDGLRTALHLMTVREPSQITGTQTPTTTPHFLQTLVVYTLKDQFGEAMGAGICADETVTLCRTSHPGPAKFGDAPTNAFGQLDDDLSVGPVPTAIPANFCRKFDQVITAGGCGPLLHNTILMQATGITLIFNGGCAVGDPCP